MSKLLKLGMKSMERITRRLYDGSIEFVDGKGYGNMTHREGVKLLFERLASYEDTGLSPEEIAEKLPVKSNAKSYLVNKGDVLYIKLNDDGGELVGTVSYVLDTGFFLENRINMIEFNQIERILS